jgi:hypothetical protein
VWKTADVNACGRKMAGVSAYAAVGANYWRWLPAVSTSSARRSCVMQKLNYIAFTFAFQQNLTLPVLGMHQISGCD